MQDQAYVLLTLLVPFGGGAVVVLLLSSWLGKVWASRILESDRARYSAEIERLKERIEFQLHSGRTFFDSELAIYKELWRHANDVRALALSIRSGFAPSQYTEAESIQRHEAFKREFVSFEHFVESHKPFFSQDVYDAALAFFTHARLENAKALANRDLSGVQLGDDRMNSVTEILQVSEALCAAIRNRLFVELAPNYSLKRTVQSLRD